MIQHRWKIVTRSPLQSRRRVKIIKCVHLAATRINIRGLIIPGSQQLVKRLPKAISTITSFKWSKDLWIEWINFSNQPPFCRIIENQARKGVGTLVAAVREQVVAEVEQPAEEVLEVGLVRTNSHLCHSKRSLIQRSILGQQVIGESHLLALAR